MRVFPNSPWAFTESGKQLRNKICLEDASIMTFAFELQNRSSCDRCN
jgi:hypothetical protein